MTCTFRDIPGVGEDPPTPQGSVTDSVIRSQSGRILDPYAPPSIYGPCGPEGLGCMA